MLFGSLARRSFLVLALILAAGCVPVEDTDDDVEEDGPSATGQWAGGVVGLTFELIVVELDDGELSGTGTVRGAGGEADVSIESGTHDHPDITMKLVAVGREPLVLSGEFENDDEIRGKANGSGLNATPFTLVRE